MLLGVCDVVSACVTVVICLVFGRGFVCVVELCICFPFVCCLLLFIITIACAVILFGYGSVGVLVGWFGLFWLIVLFAYFGFCFYILFVVFVFCGFM